MGLTTSSIHSSTKALLIAAILALRAGRYADVAVFVRLAHEREPVASVAQEKRLQQKQFTAPYIRMTSNYTVSLRRQSPGALHG